MLIRWWPWLAVILVVTGALTPDQIERLGTARDGRDHQEEAFAALVEHVAGWRSGDGDEPVRLRPDPRELVERPEASRGDLCRVTGVLEQVTPLARPLEGVTEWFVRDESDRPVVVYVVGDDAAAGRGDRVAILCRFYKRLDLVARDGVERRYAAFVGALPRRAEHATGGGSPAVAAIALAVLLAALVVLLAITRRPRVRATRRAVLHDDGPRLDDDRPLPDDPAAALSELRRRADDR